jgi:hypothetical protein
MCAFWMICNCKNGISSCEVARALGITQKTAWFMLHRVRKAMDIEPVHPMGWIPRDPVEIDETYIGGKPRNMHRRKPLAMGDVDHKAIVMGMLSRGSREVRAKVIPNVKRDTLQSEILKNVGRSSHVYIDQWSGYDGLHKVNDYRSQDRESHGRVCERQSPHSGHRELLVAAETRSAWHLRCCRAVPSRPLLG